MMFVCLLAAALSFSRQDASIAYETAKSFVASCTPRDAGTVQGGLAANWLQKRIAATGANVRRDAFTAPTPKGVRRFANLYAEFERDPTNRWVVLVSHYDTKNGCPGANDGASTSGLLVALANVLAKQKASAGNVLLVWTDGEECMGERYAENDGFQGSRRAVEYVKRRPVRAVLCLDMLGDRDLSITLPANGTPVLARTVLRAAQRIGEPDLVRPSRLNVSDDHVAFLAAGYPALDLIDFEYGPGNGWWHTQEDTVDKISAVSLLKAGRLVCETMNLLSDAP